MIPHTTADQPPFREPLIRTLARNLAIAAAVGGAFAVRERSIALWLPISVLALWFSLGGHYVELLFLHLIRPRIRVGTARFVWRLVVWFLGGAILYTCMAVTARALPVVPPQVRMWWFGGLLLIGIELIVHAVLAFRSLPNFYRGTG